MGKKKNNALRGDTRSGYGFPDDIKKLEKELCVPKDKPQVWGGNKTNGKSKGRYNKYS